MMVMDLKDLPDIRNAGPDPAAGRDAVDTSGKAERRQGIPDRRRRPMDRRQFIDIGLVLENEKRVTAADRRQGPADRRKK